MTKLVFRLKGGSGSGHFGHSGRPGREGGSLPGKGTSGARIVIDPTMSGLNYKVGDTYTDSSGNKYRVNNVISSSRLNVTPISDSEDIALGIDLKTVRPDDLVSGFDSYIGDMENNIRMDPDEWEKYQKREFPYLRDMLGDFGNFPPKPSDMSWDDYQKLTDKIANAALHNVGYK